MGTMTVNIKDETENRLRTYVWNKYHGKGKGTLGKTIDAAVTEFLDRHESEVDSG